MHSQFFVKVLDIIAPFSDNAFMNYPGGKGGVFQKLINLMPPHEVYIETHLGGGAVMRNKCAAGSNIGIEIDPEVVEMWTKMQPIGFELVHDDAVNYLSNYRFTRATSKIFVSNYKEKKIRI